MRANPLLRVLLSTTAIAAIASVSPARAGFPPGCPPCSTIPTSITLGGFTASGSADPQTAYTVVIRNLDQSPSVNSSVTLDFSGCTGVELCATQPDPGVYAGNLCGQGRVTAVTDIQGSATFRLVGSGVPNATCAPYACVQVYVDGAFFGYATAHTPDLDGAGGVSPSDLSEWLQLFFAGGNCSRADYDGSGDVGPGDLSAWLEFHFASGSVASCGALCP
jgi:hypothetical protein